MLIQIPAVQDFGREKAVSFLEEKFQTPVKIGKLDIDFPKKIVLEDFYFEDEQQDTLAAGERLAVNINFYKLVSNTFDISSIELEGAVIKIDRNQDSIFNFDYMAEAFATNQPKDTTATAMEISLGDITLDRVRFEMEDAVTKIDVDLRVNHLDTYVETFDLEQMDFGVPNINIDGLTLNLDQGLLENENSTAANEDNSSAEETAPLNINLGDINLTNIRINFNSEEANINSAFSLKELKAEIDDFKFPQEFVAISNIQVTGLEGRVILPKTSEENVTVIDSSTTAAASGNNWKVKVNNADFNNLAFVFKDENTPRVEQGIDYGDLDINDLDLEADDFYYSLDSISGNINSSSMREKSGLVIESLRTNFLYSDNGAYLKELYLETPHTVIQEKILLGYESLETLQNNLGEVEIEANLTNSKIGFQDILLLAPDLRDIEPFKGNPNTTIFVDGKVSGQINNLKITDFRASGFGSTAVAVTGTITGLPDAETARYNLDLNTFRTTARDLGQILPKGTIPDSINIPERFNATGSFTGTAENFKTRIDLESTAGSANIVAEVDMRQENAETYMADIQFNNFELGKLIQNDSLGALTLNVEVKGVGFDPETADAIASGTIEKAVYNSYAYEDLKFEGKMEDGVFRLDALMEDPNINFELTASGSFQGEYPSIELVADIKNIALDSLNLYASPLRFEGTVKADLETADPDHLNGEVLITDLIAENGKQRFPLDSIYLKSTATATADSLLLYSQFVKAKMAGDYQLTKIGTALTKTISNYYDLNAVPDTTTVPPQNFKFEVIVNNDPILTQLMPDIKLDYPIQVVGRYDSQPDSLTVNGKIPGMRYLDYKITNAAFNIETEDDALTYEIILDDVQSPQIQLFHTEISGAIANNEILYVLEIDDSTGDLQYRIAGMLEAMGDSQRISLEIENLILNYDKWQIPENNSITIAPTGVMATNFEISNNDQAIRINSQTQDPSAPMEVVFDDFKLQTISAMISKDTLLAGGTLNGDVILNNLTENPQFEADLRLANFTFKRDTVGDLQINVNNLAANLLQTEVIITGNGNNAEIAGTYNTETNALNFDVDLQRLGIESIQGFSFGSIADGEGYLSGDLSIDGTVDNPDITGLIDFNEVAFRVTQLDAYFKDMNESIYFTPEGIRMDNFSISDVNNNELIINGTLNTRDYTDYAFNLTVKAENFKAISSTAEDNDFYYGDLIIDTNLRIGGTLNNPAVNGSLNIQDGTDLTLVLPQEDPTIADREGVVEFVDETSQRMAEMEEIEETVNTTVMQGMDISLNIDINEEAEFTMIIDQGNGDFISLKGEAQLTAGIDPSGKINLTGRYEFTEGAYVMSFNFIKRRFEITSGSYIQWTGEPTSANINLTAIYEAETAPIDLLGNQLANLTQGARNTYKEEIPFEVVLLMTGELLEPELAFDIRLPEGSYGVSSEILNNSRAKLAQLRQQPSELNKQVFALLLLNRFIGENPFASEAGGTSAESLARQSVSKILSEQLNNLAGDLISGVELNFDLESTEDYSTGQLEQKTDLNVGLSKRLLNDRLNVTIGSSFGIEGSQQANQQANNIAGDVEVEYALSKDGRYTLRAYRKNEYEVALQGQIIETGVAFVITLDYDYFMEIFGRDPKE